MKYLSNIYFVAGTEQGPGKNTKMVVHASFSQKKNSLSLIIVAYN